MRPSLTLACLLALAPLLHAGWIIQGSQTDAGQPPQTHTTFLDPRGLRVESPEGLIIFQSAGKKFILADAATKTYQVMDRDSLKQIAESMKAAMKQMESALAEMTPEQRAMMNQIMGGQMPSAPAPPPTPVATVYKKIADGIAVGPWKTTHYEVLENGVKESEVWLASPGDLPIDRDLIKLFSEMSKFFEEMTAALPMAAPARKETWSLELDGPDAPPGIPVKEIIFRDGAPVSTWELNRAEKADLDAEKFAIPAGFTRTELPAFNDE
jgi:hypothetical protein